MIKKTSILEIAVNKFSKLHFQKRFYSTVYNINQYKMCNYPQNNLAKVCG